MRACAVCPNERYQTAEELCKVLTRFIDGEKHADRRRAIRDKSWSLKQRYARKSAWVVVLAAMMISIFAVSTRVVQIPFWQSSDRQLVKNMQVASRGIKSHRSKYEADETAKAADLQVAISKNNSQLPTVAYRVGVAEDDAEEEADGNVKLKSNDLDMIWNEGPQLIGLRFSSIQIPAKAKIPQRLHSVRSR